MATGFSEDDLLDAELMEAFSCYDQDDVSDDSSILANHNRENLPPNLSSLNSELSSAFKTSNTSQKPAASKCSEPESSEKTETDGVSENLQLLKSLDEKRNRVLENLKKGGLAVGISAEFSGPRFFDNHSGFTIGNPILSKEDLNKKMEGKKNFRLSTLKGKMRMHTLSEVNFVVFGVVSRRYEPRNATNGKKFCSFLLSDLEHTSLRLSVFHEDYKNLHKEGEGVVIGVLNPSLRLEDEPVLSVNDPRYILLLGRCLEFSFCQATAHKTGQRCQIPVNKRLTDYCEFHLAKAYKQSKSKRAGFNSGITEPLKEKQRRAKIIESNHNKFVMRTGKEYLYGREISSPNMNKSNRQSNFNSGGGVSFSVSMNPKVNAKDVDGLRLVDDVNFQGRDSLVSTTLDELKSIPTLGALNLRKVQDVKGIDPLVSKEKSVSEEFTARDLLNQQRDKEEEQKKKQAEKKLMIDLGSPSLNEPYLNKTETTVRMPEPSQMSRKPIKTVTAAELRKMKAAAKLKKTEMARDSDRRERIMKRVLDNRSSDESGDKNIPDDKKRKTGFDEKEKRGKSSTSLIESVLNLKSKFCSELDEMEKEHQETYFNTREKKELIEQRLSEVMEIKVRAVTCKTCSYIAPSLSDKCKRDNHVHSWSEERKRFFKCSDCKERTISYRRYPTQPCRKCGGRSFDRTSMVEGGNTSIPIHSIEYFKIADAEDFVYKQK